MDPRIEAMARAIYEADPESGFIFNDLRTAWRASDSYWTDQVWTIWTLIATDVFAAYTKHPLTVAEREVIEEAMKCERSFQTEEQTDLGPLRDACARLAALREDKHD